MDARCPVGFAAYGPYKQCDARSSDGEGRINRQVVVNAFAEDIVGEIGDILGANLIFALQASSAVAVKHAGVFVVIFPGVQSALRIVVVVQCKHEADFRLLWFQVTSSSPVRGGHCEDRKRPHRRILSVTHTSWRRSADQHFID